MGIGFGLKARLHLGQIGQVVDHPGEADGRGVFAGEEHGDHVGEDLGVGEGRAVVVARGQHGFEEVGRAFDEFRLLREPRPRLVDELGDDFMDGPERCFQRAVGREAEEMPVGNGRVDTAVEHREDAFEVLLDDLALAFQRVHVVAEGEVRRDVDGVAHQVVLHLDVGPACGGTFPTVAQAFRDRAEHGEERTEMGGVEGARGQFALPLPILAFGREDSVDAEFAEDGFNLVETSISFRPLPEDFLDQLRLGDGDDRTRSQPEGEHRSELVAPTPQHAVELIKVELQQVADERQASWSGKVGDHPGGRGHGRRSKGETERMLKSGFTAVHQ